MGNYCKKLKTHTTDNGPDAVKTVAEIPPESANIVEKLVKKRKK